jgi:DNA polymerase-3 subunit alpha
MKWVSLHHHSTYSFMDGFGTPEQHVDRAAELGMPALFLTEHGNVSSHVRHEKAANKAGIKAGFGCELYTGAVDEESRSKFKWHLTVLAENAEGYRNLMRLVTMGWSEGFYYEPTVSGEMLAEHSEGLIVLSGCSGSKFACDLLGGKGVDPHAADIRTAQRTAEKFQRLLGDRFYLEAQAFPELERSRTINAAQVEISKRTGIPIVATGDVHYTRPEEGKMQAILHAAGRGNKSVEWQLQSWGYDVPLAPLDDAKVLQRMMGAGMPNKAWAERAIAMTQEVAGRCNVVLPKAEPLSYPTPDGMTSRDLVWKWLRAGWKFRWENNTSMRQHKWEYVERMKYEMELIESKDFIDYFLMLSDAVRWAKDRGIPVGPARGSAAASLVCYLLRITEIDPIPFPNMLFERFIDINRTDLPDVDLDFDDERREELRQYCIDKYGEECVGNVGTYTRYRGKTSLDDVARVNRIPGWEVQDVKDLLVTRSGGDSRFDASVEDTIDMFPAAKAVFDKYPELYDAVALEGNVKGMGIHAAGLVISSQPLTDIAALYVRKSKGRELQVLSVDKYDAEYLNLLKADFLGLSTMGMIRIAIELVGMSLNDLYNLPLDDVPTIQAFHQNDVNGIFQFGGGTTKIVNADVRPDNFLELCDINALARPGPLHSGSTADYIDVKHGRKKAEHLHPIVDKITTWTQFQIIYQEQILQILREMGGLPWAHIQEIRKIISLKKGEGAFAQKLDMFLDGAKERHGIEHDLAMTVWRKLVTAGQYAFNASHCVSYSLLAYWTMWLKVHHPYEFYTGCLRKYRDETMPLLKDAKKHDVEFRPPDVSRSDVDWSLRRMRDGSRQILAGFQQVRGIGGSLGATIVEDRAKFGAFRDWDALLRVKGIGPSKMAEMRRFTDDDDPFGVNRLTEVLEKIRAQIDSRALPLPQPTHTSDSIPTDADKLEVTWVGVPFDRVPQDYIEDERARTGEDWEEVKKRIKDPHLSKKMVLKCVDDGDTVVYLRFDRWRFPKFEEALWGINLNKDIVVATGIKRKGFGTGIQVRKLWILDPDN